MKFTLSWLKDHLDTTASVEDIADALTDLGLEVEGVENPAAKLAAFTLAQIKEAKPHPDADRLRVCTVATIDGDKQIVCGAPNARAGITVVLARPGDYVPGIDVTLSVGMIRGVESHGMMCSERELELSDEHNGIIELPAGKVGQSFADYLAEHDPRLIDPVIEIAITPNRQDALGVRGIARDLAARGLGRLKPYEVTPVAGQFPCPIAVSIAPDTLTDAPHFAGRVIRGVKNGPSPEWLQARLKAIGLRPISALVDITNFFTFDQNRPLHVFDADKVAGGLRVHRAAGGEEFLALDDKTYTLSQGQVVISDDRAVESLAGIMGGAESGCSEDTVNVFLESAWWEPVQIAMTGRALRVNSDARYRFERGVDPEFTLLGLEAATQMILDLCGGQPSDIVEAGQAPATARSYRLDTARVSRLVGMDIPRATQIESLTALGFSATGAGETLEVWVPSWRRDVQGEADLVEEIARIASLTKLAPKPLPRLHTGVTRQTLTPLQQREHAVRHAIAAAGYNECVTYSFIDQASAKLFGGGDDRMRLENPISADLSHMRPNLLPGLLQAAARNQARGQNELALFEVGAAFHGGEPGEQHLCAAGILVGQSAQRDPHGSRRAVDIFDAKADAQIALAAMGAPARMQVLRGGPDWWHPGRHGMFCLGPKKILGIFGEIHPSILRAMDVKGPVVAFTLFPEEIPFAKSASASKGALQISDLQAVERDFAFVTDIAVESADLVSAALGADKSLIEDVRVFDEFIGGALGEGRKSLALTVRLQPRAQTLTEEDIEAVAAKIIDKVTRATGAVLRG